MKNILSIGTCLLIVLSACSKISPPVKPGIESKLQDSYKFQQQEHKVTDEKVVSQTVQPALLKDPEIGEYLPYKLRYKVVLDAVSRAGLKDPDSALVKYSSLSKAVHFKVKSNGDKVFEFGDFISVSVNAKNSYGGYVGYETTKYFLRDKDTTALTASDADLYKDASKCGSSLSELKACFGYPEKWQPIQLHDPYEGRK